MLKDFISGLRRWVDPPSADRRLAPRSEEPSIVVYYWDGSAPEGRRLRDVSATGAYIVTSERWYPGTIVRLILQEFKVPPHGGLPGFKTASNGELQELKTASNGDLVPSKSTALLSRVVRHGPDGVGVEFILTSGAEREALDTFLAAIPKTCDIRKEGQALIEFALVLPLLFLLVVNTINFGGFFFAWITVANAARAGTQYMIRGGATVGTPTPVPAAQVIALVTNDIFSLPNRGSLVVRVCANNNGVVACVGSGSGMPALDPEPVSYVLGSVDVTYTYRPFIPLWDFSKLGIHATLPASTIHRQVSMRMLL